ncbi:MAG TPA: class I SAM-dependent methyltransferase [Haliangiales bacterium]|nr:class I SAM-dependent methyltransferase [Haliangiales bacterium]
MSRYDDIHVVAGAVLRRYQARRKQVLELNARLMRFDDWLPAHGVPRVEPFVDAWDFVAFHSFQPGFAPFSADDLLHLGELEAGLDAGASPGRAALERRLEAAGWLAGGPPDLADLDRLIVRALVDFAALQNPWELRRFLAIVAERAPRAVVEIGTAAGGLFFALAALAAPDAALVSVDLPPSAYVEGAPDLVYDLLPSLARRGQEVHLVRGSSLAVDTRAEVELVLGGRPVDLLVIDGDHAYGAARSDFDMYAPLVRPGGLIALHDAAIDSASGGGGFDVHVLWRELAARHRGELLVDPGGLVGLRALARAPAGDRRPMACGWGLLYI